MSEVAERMGTTPSTASGVIDGLAQRGLVDRVEDPTDRRQVFVRATAAAQEQLDHVHELGRGQLRQMLAGVDSTDDLATIERAIEILTAAAATTEDRT
jgi:DNA-binding MarR family transcriptional regulator